VKHSLSDSAQSAILAASHPLDRPVRDDFILAVARELEAIGREVGPGDVHRAIEIAQRMFFVPPESGSRLGVPSESRRSVA
jgi:hypothetical protein